MLDRRLRRYIRNGTLTQLAAFEAVVQLGSFTRAADALHMAQPTVSLLVKKLGETLGVPLFKSKSREIRLTAAGTETYSFCQEFFRSFAGLDDRLIELRLATAYALRIAICTGAESTIPAMLCGFCKQYPDTKLSLSVANRAHLLDRLAMGTDDFYVFGVPPDDADVCMHPLCTDEFNIYTSVAHPYARRKKLSLAEIAREPLLMREAGSRARQVADALFAEHECRPNIRMEMDNNDAIKCAVAAGFGIALLSQHAVGPNPHREALASLQVDGLPVRHQWQLVYRPDKNLSGTEQRLIDELCRQAIAPSAINTRIAFEEIASA
ncbi:MAG TPA: LysR family transcriptional regulator [Burkholderiales bacterium]